MGLVAVVAAAVLGGLVPHAVASGTESVGVTMVQVAESPLVFPTTCTDATCGKGTPAPAAPTPGIVLAAVAGRPRGRRRRGRTDPPSAGVDRRFAQRPTRPALPPSAVLLAQSTRLRLAGPLALERADVTA